MAWCLKYYECSRCSTKWTDEWSCACNDRCPSCRTETEPYDDEDLSYIVRPVARGKFEVAFSPESAESAPKYKPIAVFDKESDALAFVDAQHR